MDNLEKYNYVLPKALIAQSAVHPRDHCRLLVLQAGGKNTEAAIEHKHFYDLVDYLQAGDVLVVNDTKVKAAKLVGKKETGGKVEVILTEKVKGRERVYRCRIKGSKVREGIKLIFPHNLAQVVKKDDHIFQVEFSRKINTVDLILPTPPYVKKAIPEQDYQTVFARHPGSLAAPTAGLHFTKRLLRQIQRKGVKIAKIRLDISYETFLPVRDLLTHKTGKEYFELDAENAAIINGAITDARRLVAVGTTVVKCLESCPWKEGKVIPAKGSSDIFIRPGYKFKAPIKVLITNFHLPKSSLLLLVCAYVGKERILQAYQEAIKRKYRFYSLGEVMMVFKE